MIDTLCEQLSKLAEDSATVSCWPARQLALCAEHGVFQWFIPTEYGGKGWNDRQQLEGYIALSQACLTTAFVLTQWNAACKRIAASPNRKLRDLFLSQLAHGELFATVGISHLTTSRQHLAQPAVSAQASTAGGFVLNGCTPWVTGAAQADLIVVGATLDGGDQILCVVPKNRAGFEPGPGVKLVALTSSCTDQVILRDVHVDADELLAGPTSNVMNVGSGGGPGGLQTSALAIGLATAAVEFLRKETTKRSDLTAVAEKLGHDVDLLRAQLLALADGENPVSPGDLRQKANSLVNRATQAALAAAKGAGFIDGHCAGRWCREALFFLVWSCPQPVLSANLCELAQLG